MHLEGDNGYEQRIVLFGRGPSLFSLGLSTFSHFPVGSDFIPFVERPNHELATLGARRRK